MATPNLNMDLPVVSVTPGPEWATKIDAALSGPVDAHDHTSGKGAAIPSSALDINADLPFGGNSPTGMGSAQFTSQTVALTGIESALYFLDGDLYAIDGDGNAIQMTVGGVIASGIVGNISGLTSPATAAYAASTFTWKSTANRYAVMAGGPLSLRRADEDNPNAITMQPAASTATQTITLPAALPGASAFVTMDSSGNLGYTPALSQGITRAMQAAVGQQVSSSVTTTGNATSYTAVTGLSVTITTTGRPIVIMCKPEDAGGGSCFTTLCTGDDAYFHWRVSVTGSATTTVGETFVRTDDNFVVGGTQYPPSVLSTIYAAAAGTYTFTVQMKKSGAASTSYAIVKVQLLAYEL